MQRWIFPHRLNPHRLSRPCVLSAVSCAFLCVVLVLSASAQQANFRKHHVSFAQQQQPFTVYFIDVEGGQSTLFVTPSHQSLLVDTGWPDHDGRDAKRILAAVKLAGLDHIDFLLITHFHQDHVGGVPNLARQIPIRTFIDHGPNRQPTDAATQTAWENYQAVLRSSSTQHILATPGQTIPLTGLTVTIVSADGNLIDTPLPGTGQPNPACKTSSTRPPDHTENPRSVGIVLQYGSTRIVDLGDLTWAKEMQLMCPDNKLGQADVYVVSHHGTFSSSSPALVDGIAPRLAIMDNGEIKGGAPTAWDILEKSPRLADLWQLHFSQHGGMQHNVADRHIANLPNDSDGNFLRLDAYPDRRLTVYNSRTGDSQNYPAP